MARLKGEIDSLAGSSGFSGVVRIDRGDTVEVAKAFGAAHRGLGIPNDVETQFAIASGSKGFTAIVVASLIGWQRPSAVRAPLRRSNASRKARFRAGVIPGTTSTRAVLRGRSIQSDWDRPMLQGADRFSRRRAR